MRGRGILTVAIVLVLLVVGVVVLASVQRSRSSDVALVDTQPPSTPQSTSNLVNTPSASPTAEPSATSSLTPSATSTASVTPTATASNTATANPTQIFEATLIPTADLAFQTSERLGDNNISQVWVSSGSFQAGDPDGIGFDDEQPHRVFTDAFWIDKFAVTNSEFARCPEEVCGNPHKLGSHVRPDGYYGVSAFDDFPVIQVTWQQASNYCEWRNARLPSEAEFEKAAGWDPRTGQTYTYPWGNEPPNDGLANFDGIDRDTQKVGSYPVGASPTGALDMSGNVWQWTADWHNPEYYVDNDDWINPRGPETGEHRVIRGGSWFSNNSGFLRVANRGTNRPENYGNEIGFRCVSDQ